MQSSLGGIVNLSKLIINYPCGLTYHNLVYTFSIITFDFVKLDCNEIVKFPTKSANFAFFGSILWFPFQYLTSPYLFDSFVSVS